MQTCKGKENYNNMKKEAEKNKEKEMKKDKLKYYGSHLTNYPAKEKIYE